MVLRGADPRDSMALARRVRTRTCEMRHAPIAVKTARTTGNNAIVVPAGSRHNLINTGDKSLRLYTRYGPPNHLDQLIQVAKAEASASKEAFAGATTE